MGGGASRSRAYAETTNSKTDEVEDDFDKKNILTASFDKSMQMTRGEVEKMTARASVVGDLDTIMDEEVQQSINCCNITSVAFALTVLGFQTTVDDIFMETDCDPAFVVNSGLTLAQTYGLAERYIHKKKYDLCCRVYHFDEACVTLEGFWLAVCHNACDAETVIVSNFHSGIAHGLEKGGGHFAIIAAVRRTLRSVVMSDVHPIKYGRFWSTPVECLFRAMVDKDSDSNRSRGLLIFGPASKSINMPGLDATCRVVSWRTPVLDLGATWQGREALLQRFVPQEVNAFNTSVNMTGATAVALALYALTPEDPGRWNVREVMKESGSSYTRHLNTFVSVEELKSLIDKLPGFVSKLAPLEKITDIQKGGAALAQFLSDVSNTESVALVRFDVNVAYGSEVQQKLSGEAGALSHGANSWCAVAGVDGIKVVLADTHPIAMGRFWWCEAQQLFAAMRAVHTPACIVIEREIEVTDVTDS